MPITLIHITAFGKKYQTPFDAVYEIPLWITKTDIIITYVFTAAAKKIQSDGRIIKCGQG